MPLLRIKGTARKQLKLDENPREKRLWTQILQGKPADELMRNYQVRLQRMLEGKYYSYCDVTPAIDDELIYFKFTINNEEWVVYNFNDQRYVAKLAKVEDGVLVYT